uniref:ATP-binding cassette transporter subfamily G-like protein 10 n=1 Tax=Brachionus rotundiformis TaxID=96890 RepID=A0A7H9SL18_9BILA|nr:ATP-binding cassette transporter subfamily G-like protein 10 [Brachionus rotundiformis]QNH67911.1 ATP-binding cassette transporter subfamily H-like protein 1 [Brachionus rotundiformis]
MSFKNSNGDRFIYQLSNNYLINESELNLSVDNLKTDLQNEQNITVLNIKMEESSHEFDHSKENDKAKNAPLLNYQKMKEEKKRFHKNKTLILTWQNVTVCPRKKKSILKFFDSQDDESYSVIEKINIFKKKNVEKPIISSSYNSVLKLENQSIESVSSISTSSTHKRKNGKILDNVSGLAKSGECIAIMGASGAGKTTLLNALNFRNSTRYIISGKIKLNGKLINGDELSNRCAYIQQDDLFITTLTVKEHLTFMAMLKMGSNFSKEQKIERVHEIIREKNVKIPRSGGLITRREYLVEKRGVFLLHLR